jgi:hypothetical protein
MDSGGTSRAKSFSLSPPLLGLFMKREKMMTKC